MSNEQKDKLIHNIFEKLVDDMSDKWNKLEDDITIGKISINQYHKELNDLDDKVIKFLQMAPYEVVTYRDEDGNNLGHYTAVFSLKKATNMLYQYGNLSEQKNFSGDTIATFAEDNRIELQPKIKK